MGWMPPASDSSSLCFFFAAHIRSAGSCGAILARMPSGLSSLLAPEYSLA